MNKKRLKAAKPVSKQLDPHEIDLTVTEAAWEKYEPTIKALAPAELLDARLDVTFAAAIAMAGVANVLAQREALSAEFAEPDFAGLEAITEIAQAAVHSDLLHRISTDSVAPFADLLPRANELRGAMLDDLSAQVRRRRAPGALLDGIRAGDQSARDKANDLNDLASWYRSNWSSVEGKTTVEPDEITEASALATSLLARIGALRAATTPKPGEPSSSELRRRAFSLLAREYDIARRYGAYLFFELPEGWEAYVPSLRSRAGGRPAARPEETPSEPVSPAE